MYLPDTNVASELRKQRPHGAVVSWLKAADDAKLFLSAVTLGEIQAWLELVASAYHVLPMDSLAFRHWARLMHRKSHIYTKTP